jgi:hypothetical protein
MTRLKTTNNWSSSAIIDNMFSRNTSKLLTFNVTSDEPIEDGLEIDEFDMSGWLLKKRRKRMQGNHKKIESKQYNNL